VAGLASPIQLAVFGDESSSTALNATLTMAGNLLIDCASDQGALAIKGEDSSSHNVIENNRVQSDRGFRALYVTGGRNATIRDNYVKVPNANNGIFSNNSGRVVFAGDTEGKICL